MNEEIIQLFEVIMVVCFGISWPISIFKLLKSKSSKGKSVIFSCFIIIGYISGLLGKILGHKFNYVAIFYIINTVMVSIDLFLCIKYRSPKVVEAN